MKATVKFQDSAAFTELQKTQISAWISENPSIHESDTEGNHYSVSRSMWSGVPQVWYNHSGGKSASMPKLPTLVGEEDKSYSANNADRIYKNLWS